MTDKEMLERIVARGNCIGIYCDDCPLMSFCHNHVSDLMIDFNSRITNEANNILFNKEVEEFLKND